MGLRLPPGTALNSGSVHEAHEVVRGSRGYGWLEDGAKLVSCLKVRQDQVTNENEG